MVAPGWVGTDMSWGYINGIGDRGPLGEDTLGTLTPPEEVANVVTFLASDAARRATGTVIDIKACRFRTERKPVDSAACVVRWRREGDVE